MIPGVATEIVLVRHGETEWSRDGKHTGNPDVPHTARGDHYTGVLPDKITLFAGPLWRSTGGDEDRLLAAVRHTVAHEVAHHFGISDERLLEIDAY